MTLKALLDGADDQTTHPFGQYEEEAIVSLALDFPEFFMSVAHFLKPDMFNRLEVQFVMAHLLNAYEQHGTIPTRPLFLDSLKRVLKPSDPFDDILAVAARPSNHREVPQIRAVLRDWTRNKAFGQLYSQEAIEAYHRQDYDYLMKIVEDASHITDVGGKGIWLFEQADDIMAERAVVHYPTGWPRLDEILNEGGPSPGEVVVWMAATNVGKSIVLCNNAINSCVNGLDTLFVTCELSAIKTGLRCLGALTRTQMSQLRRDRENVLRVCEQYRNSKAGRMAIYELPPDESSVNDIYSIIGTLKRTRGWAPKVVCIDYLELLMSRERHNNRDEYIRQKRVGTEVRGLAMKEGVLVYTATQTNRSGAVADEMIDLDKSAESYGKNMPLDYVISLNQSPSQYAMVPARLDFFVAKNRNGPKRQTIGATINYLNMKVEIDNGNAIAV